MSDVVRSWVDKYISAWTTNEPEDIRALFTEAAVYFTRPHHKDPWNGREQIVEHWLVERDEPEEWTFEWSLLGTDGDLAFVQGYTDYIGDRPSYDNLWIIRLTADGRASEFTEWFMERRP
ncbi:MAG: nuclear transport factor 2 family protein [Arthrobacter sp.]